MKKNIFKILLLGAVLGILIMPGRPQAAGGDFFITLIPENPKPGSTVTAKIKSFQFDINRAMIEWEIGDKKILSGLGERTVKFKSPALGQTKEISASVITAKGILSSKSVILAGNDFDFLWKAETSTPAGYRGKALATIESKIKISAIPHFFSNGKKIAAENLIYDWWLNFNKQISASGAGKNSFSFRLKNYADYSVILKVSNRENTASFEKGFIISANDARPEVILYEDHPLEGPRYEKALSGKFEIDSGEITVRAEPFYFAKENLENLSYEWKMNDRPLPEEEQPNILRLRTPEEGEGEAVITVDVKNFIQFASATLNLVFGFGL